MGAPIDLAHVVGALLQAQVGIGRHARVQRRPLLGVHRPSLAEAERDLRTEPDDLEGAFDALDRMLLNAGYLTRLARHAVSIAPKTRAENLAIRPVAFAAPHPPNPGVGAVSHKCKDTRG